MGAGGHRVLRGCAVAGAVSRRLHQSRHLPGLDRLRRQQLLAASFIFVDLEEIFFFVEDLQQLMLVWASGSLFRRETPFSLCRQLPATVCGTFSFGGFWSFSSTECSVPLVLLEVEVNYLCKSLFGVM